MVGRNGRGTRLCDGGSDDEGRRTSSRGVGDVVCPREGTRAHVEDARKRWNRSTRRKLPRIARVRARRREVGRVVGAAGATRGTWCARPSRPRAHACASGLLGPSSFLLRGPTTSLAVVCVACDESRTSIVGCARALCRVGPSPWIEREPVRFRPPNRRECESGRKGTSFLSDRTVSGTEGCSEAKGRVPAL